MVFRIYGDYIHIRVQRSQLKNKSVGLGQSRSCLVNLNVAFAPGYSFALDRIESNVVTNLNNNSIGRLAFDYTIANRGGRPLEYRREFPVSNGLFDVNARPYYNSWSSCNGQETIDIRSYMEANFRDVPQGAQLWDDLARQAVQPDQPWSNISSRWRISHKIKMVNVIKFHGRSLGSRSFDFCLTLQVNFCLSQSSFIVSQIWTPVLKSPDLNYTIIKVYDGSIFALLQVRRRYVLISFSCCCFFAVAEVVDAEENCPKVVSICMRTTTSLFYVRNSALLSYFFN